MKKIVIACDSFKGSVSSIQVSKAVELAIKEVYPYCKVITLPVADGGEGTLEVLMQVKKGESVLVDVHDPLMRPLKAVYGISPDRETAFIEMAAASGLTLLTPAERNPCITTTYGTGEFIADALSRGCRNFIIGIGGSATNDAGTGMMQALGYRFFDRNGEIITTCNGEALSRIASIDAVGLLPGLKESHFTIASDVSNPFSGHQGAAYVFARQKGADEEMIKLLDEGMETYAGLVERLTGVDVECIPGAGAAGGLGGCFAAFFCAELNSGIDIILNMLEFDKQISDADMIITGEGRIDGQTLLGKVPFGILERASGKGIPVVALCGSVEESELLENAGFLAVLPVAPGPISLEDAMDVNFTEEQIHRTVRQFLRLINYFSGKFNC